MFSRLHICIYALHICIHGNICPCAQSTLHIYIYIYIYIYLEICAQATSAAGSCSQHGIIIHQSPLEATIGFYQEISQQHKEQSRKQQHYQLLLTNPTRRALYEISPDIYIRPRLGQQNNAYKLVLLATTCVRTILYFFAVCFFSQWEIQPTSLVSGVNPVKIWVKYLLKHCFICFYFYLLVLCFIFLYILQKWLPDGCGCKTLP